MEIRTHALRFECELLKKSPAMLLFYSVSPESVIRKFIVMVCDNIVTAETKKKIILHCLFGTYGGYQSKIKQCNKSLQTHPSNLDAVQK